MDGARYTGTQLRFAIAARSDRWFGSTALTCAPYYYYDRCNVARRRDLCDPYAGDARLCRVNWRLQPRGVLGGVRRASAQDMSCSCQSTAPEDFEVVATFAKKGHYEQGERLRKKAKLFRLRR